MKINMNMNKVVCRLFGHNANLEEVYAVKFNELKSNKSTYSIFKECRCSRCNAIIELEELAQGLSRAEMLKREWFITK